MKKNRRGRVAPPKQPRPRGAGKIDRAIGVVMQCLERAGAELDKQVSASEPNPVSVTKAVEAVEKAIADGKAVLSGLVATAGQRDRQRLQALIALLDRGLADLFDPNTNVGGQVAYLRSAREKQLAVDDEFAAMIADAVGDASASG